MASYQERRHTIRVGTNGQLDVECERRGPALTLVDVGSGGFGARLSAAIPIGAVASYRFTTPDRRWTATFRAKAAYCRPEILDGKSTGYFVAGFSFVTEQPPAMRQQIMAMIDIVTKFLTFS
jgi:hypothetical protein